MANQYAATLPTGRSVVLEELTTQEQLTALAAGSEHHTPHQAQFAAQLESIRHMLRQVDGKPVRYTDIEGAKLDGVIAPKEIACLAILYGEIMGAGEAEKKALLASLKMSSGES